MTHERQEREIPEDNQDNPDSPADNNIACDKQGFRTCDHQDFDVVLHIPPCASPCNRVGESQIPQLAGYHNRSAGDNCSGVNLLKVLNYLFGMQLSLLVY